MEVFVSLIFLFIYSGILVASTEGIVLDFALGENGFRPACYNECVIQSKQPVRRRSEFV